jgi:hypothetical protein
VALERLLVGPEVDGVAEGLDDLEALQGVQGLHRPVPVQELDVGVQPHDVAGVQRQPGGRGVDHRLLDPQLVVAAEADVSGVVGLGDLVVALAERRLDHPQGDARERHALQELAEQPGAALIAHGVRQHADDVQVGRSHGGSTKPVRKSGSPDARVVGSPRVAAQAFGHAPQALGDVISRDVEALRIGAVVGGQAVDGVGQLVGFSGLVLDHRVTTGSNRECLATKAAAASPSTLPPHAA